MKDPIEERDILKILTLMDVPRVREKLADIARETVKEELKMKGEIEEEEEE